MSRKRGQYFSACDPLPRIGEWYVSLADGRIEARVPHLPYREAYQIARTLLPEYADELELILFAQVPRQMRDIAARTQLLTPEMCRRMGLLYRQQVFGGAA